MTEEKDEGKGKEESKDDLSEQLKNDVEQRLIGWQTKYTREEFCQKIFAALWPGATQAEVLEWMVSRFGTFQGHIKTAHDNGQLYPWIVPYSATVMLESTFQACVGFWLLAGKPDDQTQLQPSVKEYVALQVRSFVLMVGR